MDGFAVKGRFTAKGDYVVTTLVCLSPKCLGQSEINIENGILK